MGDPFIFVGIGIGLGVAVIGELIAYLLSLKAEAKND